MLIKCLIPYAFAIIFNSDNQVLLRYCNNGNGHSHYKLIEKPVKQIPVIHLDCESYFFDNGFETVKQKLLKHTIKRLGFAYDPTFNLGRLMLVEQLLEGHQERHLSLFFVLFGEKCIFDETNYMDKSLKWVNIYNLQFYLNPLHAYVIKQTKKSIDAMMLKEKSVKNVNFDQIKFNKEFIEFNA